MTIGMNHARRDATQRFAARLMRLFTQEFLSIVFVQTPAAAL